MSQLKIVLIVVTAVILQSALRNVWAPLVYIDFPLIVAVYFGLQRDAIKAVLVGSFAGLATDALSAGLLGSNGFSKALTAYIVAALSTQVMLDNPLARIPVLAGAALIDTAVFFSATSLVRAALGIILCRDHGLSVDLDDGSGNRCLLCAQRIL
ncbi:MAG: rod shape-determining protein MreD [Pyrinomonadaceae bacterium]